MFSVSENSSFTGEKSTTFNCANAVEPLEFHRRMPNYKPTRLVALKQLAKHLGLKNILVKDESHRFDLNAFKVLGGSYALAKVICERLNIEIAEFDFTTTPSLLPEPITFVTATAGNHGTGIAWAARQLRQNAYVLMPSGASPEYVARIKSLGAECTVTDVNYDHTVRQAEVLARKNGWVLVQDTAWEGYEEIPTWISQGYMSMAAEAVDQMAQEEDTPTHVMLQGGVGAMAGGVLGYLADKLGVLTFKCIVSEPAAADCLKRSSESPTAGLVAVEGNLDSILKGLACREVNPVTWDVLKNCARFFASVDDRVTATGMRVSASPLPGDEIIVSGCSGAINLGLLFAILTDPNHEQWRSLLGLDSTSVVLLFSTEGNTNVDLYREIVWGGRYASA